MKKSIKWSLATVLCLIVVAGGLFFVNSSNEAETASKSNEPTGNGATPTYKDNTGDSRIKHFTYQDANNNKEKLCIMFESVDGAVMGSVIGTTDEFASAREGYLPGYFERPMQELSLNGDVMTFTIYADDGEFYANPFGCAMCMAGERFHFTEGNPEGEKYENADYFKGLKVKYVLDIKNGGLTSYQYPYANDTLSVNKFVRITNAPM